MVGATAAVVALRFGWRQRGSVRARRYRLQAIGTSVVVERFCDLERVLVERGGLVSSAVEPHSTPTAGTGLRASCAVELGTLLVSAPPSCQLCWADEDRECLDAQRQVQEAVERDVPPELWDVRLAALVLAAQQQLLEPWWAGYAASLLSSPPLLPLFWNGGELRTASEMYPLLAKETSSKAVMLKSVAKGLSAQTGFTELMGQVTTRTLALAYAVVSSRSIRLSAAAGVLVPVVDLANHSFEANVALKRRANGPRAGHIEMVATKAIPRGAPLLLNYGPHTNQRLMLDYGFDVVDNPHGQA